MTDQVPKIHDPYQCTAYTRADKWYCTMRYLHGGLHYSPMGNFSAEEWIVPKPVVCQFCGDIFPSGKVGGHPATHYRTELVERTLARKFAEMRPEDIR